eukprot:2836640-Rhodomonas_salina.1
MGLTREEVRDVLVSPEASGSTLGTGASGSSIDSTELHKRQARLISAQKCEANARAMTERTRNAAENVAYQMKLFQVVQDLEDQLDHTSCRFTQDPSSLVRMMLEAKRAELVASLNAEKSLEPPRRNDVSAPSTPAPPIPAEENSCRNLTNNLEGADTAPRVSDSQAAVANLLSFRDGTSG